MRILKADNEDITKISIQEYLEGIGIPTRKEGKRVFASSPFSVDRSWSFCIYPTNTYFDFSTGHGGNIINLVSRLHNVSLSEAAKTLRSGINNEKYKANYKALKEPERVPGPFDYKKYINTDPEECKKIKEYAASRGITEGFECGVFYTRKQRNESKILSTLVGWERVPALAFLHVDKNLKPCGIKFRRIDGKEPRFSARGRLHHYLLMPSSTDSEPLTPYNDSKPVVYVTEGETNANSLWKYFTEKYPVLSTGGVSSVLNINDLPTTLQDASFRLIIDYDGNEQLYQERLKLYEGLNATPIKMILPKGEDINSLYCRGEMWKIEHLLLQ